MARNQANQSSHMRMVDAGGCLDQQCLIFMHASLVNDAGKEDVTVLSQSLYCSV